MGYLFAYFRQVYRGRVETSAEGVYTVPLTEEVVSEESLHLAVSGDGVTWRPLQRNRSVLPGVWLRDPYLARGADGAFHILATADRGPHSILHMRSADLVIWEPPDYPRVMNAETGTRNVWAPEFVFDAKAGDYLVYWSSSYGQHGWDDSRIWCARTRDFTAFTPPRLLFDPGFTVIDATIVPAGAGYAMFFKDERFGHLHGEHRYIQKAVSAAIDGPYAVSGGAISPELCEGPAVYRLPDERWALSFDLCMANDYSLLASHDLAHWEPVREARFPANARHGSVLQITEEELAALLARTA